MTDYTWDEHFSTNQTIVNHDRLTTIPFLEYGEFFEAKIFEYLAEEFKNEDNAEIFIIDPYFTSIDFNFLVRAFGSFGYNFTFRVITKYEFIKEKKRKLFGIFNQKQITKKDIINETNKISQRIIDEGIFKNITIYHSKLKMHDRYIFLNKEENNDKFFLIGASLNQSFNNYSYIHRTKDKFFIKLLLKYTNQLISNII